MFFAIMWTFARFLPIFAFYIVAFAFGFHILFDKPPDRKSPLLLFLLNVITLLNLSLFDSGAFPESLGYEIVTTFRLFHGDFAEFYDQSIDGTSAGNVIYFLVALVLLPLLLINLFIATAIGEIGPLRENAKNARLAWEIAVLRRYQNGPFLQYFFRARHFYQNGYIVQQDPLERVSLGEDPRSHLRECKKSQRSLLALTEKLEELNEEMAKLREQAQSHAPVQRQGTKE